MAGAIGGGGLGSMALNLGYQRRMFIVLWVSVIVLVILVQIFQTIGTHFSISLDRRLTSVKENTQRPFREVSGLTFSPIFNSAFGRIIDFKNEGDFIMKLKKFTAVALASALSLACCLPAAAMPTRPPAPAATTTTQSRHH